MVVVSQEDGVITKRAKLAVAALISLLVLAFDAPMAFYWLRVQFMKGQYEPTEFVFRELKFTKGGIIGQRLLAYGLVEGKEETFSSWSDFGSQAFFAGKPTGEKWNIFYDASAPDFSFYGKTLRVMSRHEFETKGIWLAWHLLAVCLPSVSVLIVSLIYLRRANQDKDR